MNIPKGQRLHIALFGRRNVGKSSLINALTGQELAIVSDIPGTTTDPVEKSMEILPLGPVVIIDTAGIDDVGKLGELRKKKSYEVLNKADLVLLVIDPMTGFGEFEEEVVKKAKEYDTPLVHVINKIDLYPQAKTQKFPEPKVFVSAKTKEGIDELKQVIIKHAPKDWALPTIVGDLIKPGDLVVCVVPVDKAAPKGRLILPQQMVIRDILDNEAIALVVKERELRFVFEKTKVKPSLVITDASVYTKVSADTPPDIRLTSFSVLFARYKGDLQTLVEGVLAVKTLKPGDKVLIAEACTHHPVEDDIGRVKIPRWLRAQVGQDLEIEVKAGGGPLPENLEQYKLIVHCGACMLNRKEMLSRIMQAKSAKVPIVNYGVMLAYMHGILKRALSPFPHLQRLVVSEIRDYKKIADDFKCIKAFFLKRTNN
ncbi:MAG TPA: [FeFe] hydrogenase H-cluster maturation GTPase HydF [Thermodesulfobacterium commune]|uniref:[FeFe] hydrogenase H-cluster maturation GTPase HydF n=1 Tax=Thermodesulfobacterium commune TaxID=1741 RepID=A0A3B8N3E3_9BACT|nr:[FeFe] hydrogenase H-cluster maturation GTPase HydF [Thermodesulfobacterium commune]HCE80346.1 [FeFe] hydrogenase H-cluster maturation GTPase HydF [Thermodesulfobacterium commune]